MFQWDFTSICGVVWTQRSATVSYTVPTENLPYITTVRFTRCSYLLLCKILSCNLIFDICCVSCFEFSCSSSDSGFKSLSKLVFLSVWLNLRGVFWHLQQEPRTIIESIIKTEGINRPVIKIHNLLSVPGHWLSQVNGMNDSRVV